MHKALAKIVSTFLGKEDHGIFTSFIYVDYDDGGTQGIGGYTLDKWDEEKKRRVGTDYGMEFIRRTLDVIGVDEWEKLNGKIVYVLKEDDKWNSKVIGIAGVFKNKDKQLIFEDLYKELEKA